MKYQTAMIARFLPLSPARVHSGPTKTGTQSNNVVVYQGNTWEETESTTPYSKSTPTSILMRLRKRITNTISDTALTSSKSTIYSSVIVVPIGMCS